MLLEQVEASVSVAVSLASKARIAPTVKDFGIHDKDAFAVPMLYDPKFQRSPFDPYGRAPRLGSLLTFKKEKSAADRDEEKKLRESLAGIPSGLWGPADSSQISAAKIKKVWMFHSETKADDLETNPPSWSVEDTTAARKSKPPTSQGAAHRHLGDSTITSGSGILHMGSSLDHTSVDHFASRTDTVSRDYQDLQSTEPKKVKKAKKWTPKPDFEAHVRSGFVRAFACPHPGCAAEFSRAYTLKVHMKSHEQFSLYYKFKKEPMLFLDPDKSQMQRELQSRNAAKGEMLTSDELVGINEQLDILRAKSADRTDVCYLGYVVTDESIKFDESGRALALTPNGNRSFLDGIIDEKKDNTTQKREDHGMSLPLHSVSDHSIELSKTNEGTYPEHNPVRFGVDLIVDEDHLGSHNPFDDDIGFEDEDESENEKFFETKSNILVKAFMNEYPKSVFSPTANTTETDQMTNMKYDVSHTSVEQDSDYVEI